MSKTVEISRSEFAETFLYLNGRLLSLDDYRFLRDIYNENAHEVVMKFSRQTAKSTTLANIMVTNSATVPYFKTLYVAPAVDQTRVFSADRVNPIIEASPLIKEYYTSSTLVQNVFMKQFLNGSRMYLRYALLSGDRLRGYSADMNLFDEVQDLKADIIPVVQQTMSRSLIKKTMYAGTPKRSRGTLADYWFKSTQNEYMLKCGKCGHWNLLNEDNIGDHGLICKKCGKPIHVITSKGEWVSTFSQVGVKPELVGYRVCLLHFADAPWVNWEKDVLQKRRNVATGLFYNEILGLEYDEGIAPITREELMRACDNAKPMNEKPDNLEKSYQSIMGVDYGPINSQNSYTVVVVLQVRGNNEYHVVYAKKFVGKEADYAFIHSEIPRLMQVWNCSHIAADYGMGEASNSEIRKRIGATKLIAFQHMPAQKEKIRWNAKIPAYTLGRNQVMTELFGKIKHQKLKFPRWADMHLFMEDIMSIQTEYNEELGKAKYVNIGPDDFFHALLYANISAELMYGLPDIQ